MMRMLIIGLVTLLLSTSACIAQHSVLDTPAQQKSYENLIKELRCVTCPNQNIADSGAPVAQAMKAEIVRRLQAGESPEAIRSYLIDRYGEYVVYRPSQSKQNKLLWWGPLGMLLLGLGIWVFFTQSRSRDRI
jgi:cytochrome c-type biogenesis protein CcmH